MASPSPRHYLVTFISVFLFLLMCSACSLPGGIRGHAADWEAASVTQTGSLVAFRMPENPPELIPLSLSPSPSRLNRVSAYFLSQLLSTFDNISPPPSSLPFLLQKSPDLHPPSSSRPPSLRKNDACERILQHLPASATSAT